MSVNGIAKECDADYHTVLAHLNVLKLPEKYQNYVWSHPRLSVTHIQEMESLFNGGSVYTEPILKKLDQIMDEKLTSKELREVLRPEIEETERKRVEAALNFSTHRVSQPLVQGHAERLAYHFGGLNHLLGCLEGQLNCFSHVDHESLSTQTYKHLAKIGYKYLYL